MDIRRLSVCAAAALLLLAACSDPQGTEPGDAAAQTAAGAGATGTGPGDDAKPGGGSGAEDGGGKRGTGSGGSGSGPAGAGGGGSSSGGGSTGGGGNRTVAGGSALYPPSGEYLYRQDGFEQFCQGPSCEKHQLPDTQRIDATLVERSPAGATIVTEAQASEQRTMTTTTRYTGNKAVITKVVLEFAYGNFNFSQTYEPQPPVESLLFPLEVGKRWSGRWKARTSGDYKVRVTGRQGNVYRLETVTNFQGDFSGRAQMTVWVDARTRAIVKTDGDIAVASGFGEYMSSFTTTLASGPGA